MRWLKILVSSVASDVLDKYDRDQGMDILAQRKTVLDDSVNRFRKKTSFLYNTNVIYERTLVKLSLFCYSNYF